MNLPNHNPPLTLVRSIVFGLFLILGCGTSWAAEGKSSNPFVSVNANEQGLTSFLNELLGAAGYSTVISSAVEGRVNGRFEGRLDTLLRDLSRKQAITFYKVGKIVYVYRTGEIGARILSTQPAQAQRLNAAARRLGMFDENNFLAKADNGTVVAVGTPRFLDQLDELARAEKAGKPPQLAPSVPSAPAYAGGPTTKPAIPAKTATQSTATRLAAVQKKKVILGPPPIVATVPPPPPMATSNVTSAGSAATSAATAAAPGIEPNAATPGGASALRSRLPDLTPTVIEAPPASNTSISSPTLAQNSPAASNSREPLRPRIVWRSAYAPPGATTDVSN